ncbi:hypothetical protein BJV78DRAFT_343587 [Lactifluus subvellereus]|nr:hypothetical protein BJV78DRAFT_343587 [Lactifluus subvellereus]
MQHHMYPALFLPSIIAGVGSVMCSYNLVEDTYPYENNNMLKYKQDFQRPVMSNWFTEHSSQRNDWAGHVQSSRTEARVDETMTHILAVCYRNSSDYRKTNFNAMNEHVNVQDPQ